MFLSNPINELLVIQTPPLLTMIPSEQILNIYDSVSMEVRVEIPDGDETTTLTCTKTSNCRIDFHKSYTPRVFGMYPKITYLGSKNLIRFDPKSYLARVPIEDLDSDQRTFVFVRCSGSLGDTEETTSSTDVYHGWHEYNRLMVETGEWPLHQDQKCNIKWEVGDSEIVL